MLLSCSRCHNGVHSQTKAVCFIVIIAAVSLACLPVVLGNGWLNCTSGLRRFDPVRHKKRYTVGVHAPGGIDDALMAYNLTFEQYLTATAGHRFVPPIEFKMKPTQLPIHSWVDSQDEEVDFYYSDTGVYSCIGVEMGAQPLATTRSEFIVRGHQFISDLLAGKFHGDESSLP